MTSTTAATMKAAGDPRPSPLPTRMGTFKSIAVIGADPVRVRKSTPPRPTAPFLSLATSPWVETSKSSVAAVAVTGSVCAMGFPSGGPVGAWGENNR